MVKKREERLRSRFQKQADKTAQHFVASIPFDWRLYSYDIKGSIAHVNMLAKQSIIKQEHADSIKSGLLSIFDEIEQGKFKFDFELEDIHMNIENRLFEKIGDIAGAMHTARSRNDQIALDMRLFAKEAISKTINGLRLFQQVLLDIAEANENITMPGYTHLQQAQPVLFAHHLLAYFEMVQRDIGRFNECVKRVDVLPLGSGALAGVTYNIDREFVAKELGFNQISANSIDAVSDRDFIVEYEAIAAITMMHLSRLAEEIILWSSAEFGFVEIDDAFATTSSIMPQKKNPDTVELIRGKTGRVYGSLIGLLTVMKSLPLAYNRDMQEDKEMFFDTVDTLISSVEMFSGLMKTLIVNTERMNNAVSSDYILATDIADYLVKKGMSFRQAHNIVGELVKHAIKEGKELKELGLAEYNNFSKLFASDVFDINVITSIENRNIYGGTALKQVKSAITRARKIADLQNNHI
jgi:argininosuccinate lyase